MSDMPMPGPGADKNVTKTDIAKNNSNSKGKPLNAVDIKGKMKKTLEDLLQGEEEKDERTQELPEKRKRTNIDYSVFLDEKEFKNDEQFEEHLQKLQEVVEAFNQEKTTGSAYVKELERLKSSKEKNFSVKSRMMDMRKCVK